MRREGARVNTGSGETAATKIVRNESTTLQNVLEQTRFWQRTSEFCTKPGEYCVLETVNPTFVKETFYIIVSSLVQEESVDLFHRRPLARPVRPTTHQKAP
jgi:hypothetical protein